jgi:glycosyltransferase involved in cell wall biosynthesis
MSRPLLLNLDQNEAGMPGNKQMRRKICIASLLFNPSHASHLVAFARAFAEVGSEVGYVLHPGYKSMRDFAGIAPVSYYGSVPSQELNSFTDVLVYNSAIPNPAFARKMKRNGCSIMYVYHEPSISVRKAWGRSGLDSIARLGISRMFSRLMLLTSDLVILPSRQALQNYLLRDSRYNGRTLEVPLIFDDGYGSVDRRERTTFSYIGTISRAHGFDQFFAFMKYALRENLGIRFLIASRHNIPEDEILDQYAANITVRCGRPLTNGEINECYAQSRCVWNLYRLSTQSGVMANAFMCGAPVIASRTGAFTQFVKDGYNGKFADAMNHAEIAAAYYEIAAAMERYSKNSRQTFVDNFYYKSQLGRIEAMLALSHS